MRRINSSSAALVVSVVALFVALGGTAVAVTQIGTSQIKNGAVTTSKLHKKAVTTAKLANGAVTGPKLANGAVSGSKLANNAVTGSKLANNSVTGSKVADGSLTASDVAPNTFLAANGTAQNSLALGGVPADHYMQGTLVSQRRQLPQNSGVITFLSVGFGRIQGTCDASSVPKIRYVSDVAAVNLVDWVTNFGSTVDIDNSNGLVNGSFYEVPHSTQAVQSVTWQAAYTDGQQVNHVATAWTTGQSLGASGCLFIGQGVTTG